MRTDTAKRHQHDSGTAGGGRYQWRALILTLLRINTCSGGMDFTAAIVHRKHPEIGFFWITFSINACVACMSYFVYDYQIEPVILCILYSFMSSTVSDRVVRGRRSAVRCEIITDYPEAISEAIISKMHHTATLVPAKGMYSAHETSVLLAIVNKGQLPQLAEIVKEYPHTFAVISSVNDVLGNFKRLDAHGRRKKCDSRRGRESPGVIERANAVLFIFFNLFFKADFHLESCRKYRRIRRT